MSIIERAFNKVRDPAGGDIDSSRVRRVGTIRDVPSFPDTASNLPEPGSTRRIVHVDHSALIAEGYLPPSRTQRRTASQFRHVKRPLLAAALGRGIERLENGRLIMVTSSLPGEGKTFVTINISLALSLERDISVVLVDADVAKPHISRLFGIDSELGLLEAVQDETIDIESLILPTDIPNLSVLPAGKPVDTATELLASHRMQSVVAKLGMCTERQRVVIFDSPPLLVTSESHVLAQHVGQVVLVVRSGGTPQSAVLDAINVFHESKPVSLLLNQSESANEGGYYGYGHYGRNQDNESPLVVPGNRE